MNLLNDDSELRTFKLQLYWFFRHGLSKRPHHFYSGVEHQAQVFLLEDNSFRDGSTMRLFMILAGGSIKTLHGGMPKKTYTPD